MRSGAAFLLFCILLISCFCDITEQKGSEPESSPFEQNIEGNFITDYENIRWDMRDGSVENFLSIYSNSINSAKSLTLIGFTNRMAEVLMNSISKSIDSETCHLSSVVMKGIRDEDCPLMHREQRKRPCKMNRDTLLREISSVFSKCPLEELSVEGNQFSATAVIELAKNASNLMFPHLKLLDIDDNNYNYDNVAMAKMVRVIKEMPSQIEVRSFYAETLLVIQHNHGEDTPFRYNFDNRYPADCQFYSEPIKDEEFELLIKYQPCIYANSLLAHGTGRGEPWVRYMTSMFSENVYENMKNMEIFGNDLYKGDMDSFLATFTKEHFPNLHSLDMSSNGLKSIHIKEDIFPVLEKLSLDTNDLTSITIDANAMPALESLKLGYNHLLEFHIGENAVPHLKKLYLDNNQLNADVVNSVVNAPFAKSLTIFSLFNNPSIGDEADRFVDIFIKAVESHRFENLKMLYLGQCGLKSYCKHIDDVVKKNIPTIKHVTCF